MCTAWEGNCLNKILTISKFEWKMQIKRLGGWLVLVFSLAVALADNFPSAANLERLALLTKQGYVVYRLLAQPGTILFFGMLFLLSDRIRGDQTSGVQDLFMSAPLRKTQYIAGKFMGNYLFLLSIMGLYLAVNGIAHALFNPGNFTVLPYLLGFLAVVVPAGFFVTTCALTLPVLMDIRLFYAAFSILFMSNIAIVPPDGSKPPFYFLLSGGLSRLIFRNGKNVLYWDNVWGNLIFLLGAGLLMFLLIFSKRRFWRAA